MSPSHKTTGKQGVVDYWRIFRDLPEPYLLCDVSDPDYRIIEVNKAREALTGMVRADCVGRPLFDIYPYNNEQFTSTFSKDLRAQLKQVVRTGRQCQFAPIGRTQVDADGTKRTVYWQVTYIPLHDAEGVVRYILAATREVTGERQAIERVATAESRLNTALTIGKVGGWLFDTESGRITGDANFIKLFKMTKERSDDFRLNDLLDSIHQDDRQRIAAAIRESVARQRPFEAEYRVILADKTLRWVLARGKAEWHDEHVVFAGVVVDITEQRDLRAQVELARQQDRLNRQAARVLQQRNEELEAIGRSKDEFVALASHQLRTPATAVKQYLGMVLQGYVGDISEDQADVLAKAFESNERQIQIINQILSAARADTGRLVMSPIAIDLCSLTQSVMADMEASLHQREHQVVVHLPDVPVQVMADLGYLRMAIENIVHNASIYTPKGGRITVGLEQGSSDDMWVLSVTDTGVGIRTSDISKLFVKFSRIHNPLSVEAGGSGIGLYLAAEIIRLHGGSINVRSRLGRGTTFAISLPVTHNERTVSRKGHQSL